MLLALVVGVDWKGFGVDSGDARISTASWLGYNIPRQRCGWRDFFAMLFRFPFEVEKPQKACRRQNAMRLVDRFPLSTIEYFVWEFLSGCDFNSRKLSTTETETVSAQHHQISIWYIREVGRWAEESNLLSVECFDLEMSFWGEAWLRLSLKSWGKILRLRARACQVPRPGGTVRSGRKNPFGQSLLLWLIYCISKYQSNVWENTSCIYHLFLKLSKIPFLRHSIWLLLPKRV